MAQSYYYSMNFTNLLAADAKQYTNIAVRLGLDHAFRERMSAAILRRQHVLWQNQDFLKEWQLFMMTAVGYSSEVRAETKRALQDFQVGMYEWSSAARELQLLQAWPSVQR